MNKDYSFVIIMVINYHFGYAHAIFFPNEIHIYSSCSFSETYSYSLL